MNFLTKNQWLFAGALAAETILFRMGLSALLNHHQYGWTWAISVIYGLSVFIAGMYFGRKDREWLPLMDISFRYNVITYVLCNSAALAWLWLGFTSPGEKGVIYISAAAWGMGLVIHLVFFLLAKQKTIKGIDKQQLFD